MNEIYKAIRDKLVLELITNASPDVVKDIYDHVPEDLPDTGYPFLRLDQIQASNNDVDDKSGFIATIQVIGFSRYRGSLEISNIADSVYNALHRFDMPDTATYGISDIIQSFRSIKTQPDGLTRNAVQQFQIIFEPLI